MANPDPQPQGSWWRRHWLLIAFLTLGLLVGYALLATVVLPSWIVSLSAVGADANTRLNAVTSTRDALLGVLGPVVVAIGAIAGFLTYLETTSQNRRANELSQSSLAAAHSQFRETLELTRRGQLTDRFGKAIEQLGESKEDVRLGAIYALERIGKESQDLHPAIVEVLTAFLREHSRTRIGTLAVNGGALNPEQANQGAAPQPRADFQAAIAVLGRRTVAYDTEGQRIDLRGVVLDGADFRRPNADSSFVFADFAGARLQRCLFAGALLETGDFRGADLREANFDGAALPFATFEGGQLQKVSFRHSDLTNASFGPSDLSGSEPTNLVGADFREAKLTAAWFVNADLEGSQFVGAKLQNAIFLNAKLQHAVFYGADLTGADFGGANLDQTIFADPQTHAFNARGLTQAQLDKASSRTDALLPDYLQQSEAADAKVSDSGGGSGQSN